MADERIAVPGEPAGQRTPAWFRSPGGAVAHADGPSQVRAFTDQGWTEIDEAEAKRIVADGTHLEVNRADTSGTFDDDAVRTAVREEGSQAAKRSAAAKKGAATKAAKKAAAEQPKPDPSSTADSDS